MEITKGSSNLSKTRRMIMLTALGPRLGGAVIEEINHSLTHSGTEWTVVRLKAYWAAALQLRAGNHSVVKKIYQENWIAYYKGSLIPKGPLGTVLSGFVKAQRPSVIRRYALALRVYTSLRLVEPSDKQVEKAYTAINQSGSCSAQILEATQKCIAFAASRNMDLLRSAPLKAPNLGRLKAFSSYHRVRGSSNRELEQRPYGKLAVSLISNPYIPPSLRELNPLEDVRQELLYLSEDAIDPEDEPTNLGSINLIQEGGCKGRVVAMPNAWTQWLFEPLHLELDRIVRSLPDSCVHDQNLGAYAMMQAFEADRDMWCYDLSSATDRFPLSIQKWVLTKLGHNDYADALDEATWGWTSPLSNGEWVYRVGQPMGLYGSFPLFHLTHWLILKGIEIVYGIPEHQFKVLGDDVIIFDHRLASEYQHLIGFLGVELSVSKSIHSERVSEFAGFVGIKTTKSHVVFRPYKWCKDDGLISNALPFLDGMGSAAAGISPFWKKVARRYQATSRRRYPDLSPLVPQENYANPIKFRIPTLDSHRLQQLLTMADVPLSNSIYGKWTGGLIDSRPIEQACRTWLDEPDVGLLDRKIDFPRPDVSSGFPHQAESNLITDPLMREESLKERRSALLDLKESNYFQKK